MTAPEKALEALVLIVVGNLAILLTYIMLRMVIFGDLEGCR